MNFIDLRSDTVTKPSEGMYKAMLQAPLGDDVFNDDPTILKLQETCAALFNHEAALFCSSGTQTNQIAIKTHTQPTDELICHKLSHIYNYEGGGIAFNAGVQVRLLEGNNGVFEPHQVLENINADDVHFSKTSLVCIENTVNKGGGKCWTLPQMQAIKDVCKNKNIPLHLDGARLFNAITNQGYTTQQIGNIFDSISICFSKGLGCPVGSVLIGNKKFIAQARRYRKVMGGGMRQAGILAGAALYALDNNINRLQLDHDHAILLQQNLQNLNYVAQIIPVSTNIVIFELKAPHSAANFIEYLLKNNIRAVAVSPMQIRFVTHLDISKENILQINKVLQAFQ